MNPKPAWSAAFALALGVVRLIASETLPVSLLTPIAKDLGVMQGEAGQAATATAFTAFVSSLLIPVLTRRFNRRPVLLLFTALLVASNLLVAFVPNFSVLLLGRVLLGLGLGGFWSKSAASQPAFQKTDHLQCLTVGTASSRNGPKACPASMA